MVVCVFVYIKFELFGIIYSIMKHLKKHPINEELDRSTYRSAIELGKKRGDEKGRGISRTAEELLGNSIGRELAGKTFIVNPIDKKAFQKRLDSFRNAGRNAEKPPMTGQYRIEFKDYCKVRTKEENHLALVVSVKVDKADEFGGWSSDVEIRGYNGAYEDDFILNIVDGKVTLNTYNWETKFQFDRKDAREIADIARMTWEGMTGDTESGIKHNTIHQFDKYKNPPKKD